MVLTLYKFDASPSVRSVLMAIDILKIPDVIYIDINLVKGEHVKDEYVKINPERTVPTLKDDDFVVWDSHAIAVYLINTYGQDDSLYPNDPKIRALIDQRLHFDSGILYPAMRGAVAQVIFLGQKQFSEEALNKIESAYDLIEKFFTSPYLVGDIIRLADICCVSDISSMNEILPIDKDKYANLFAWLQRISEMDFYKTMNQPGLEQFRNLIKSKLE